MPAAARRVVLGGALAAHRDLLLDLWRDDRFRNPMLVIWVASFGGALHAPVSTFFYLGVGATETDLGTIGVMLNISSLVLSPLYGTLSDRHGSYSIFVLSIFLCATGCLVRGLAQDVGTLFAGAGILGLGGGQIWTLALAYLAAHTPPERREVVVSGYLAQEAALRLLGKLLFPPLDWLLRGPCGVHDELFRWRLEMGCCTAFCFYGLLLLGCCGGGMRKADEELRSRRDAADEKAAAAAAAAAAVAAVAADAAAAATGPRGSADKAVRFATEDDGASLLSGGRAAAAAAEAAEAGGPAPAASRAASRAASNASLAMAMGVLLCQSCSATIGLVLWPLYVRDRFGWSAPQYAWLILLSSAVSIAAVSSYPRLAERLGSHRVGVGACATAALSSVGFCIDDADAAAAGGYEYSRLAHVLLAVVFIAAVSLLEPCVKSIVSSHGGSGAQGRSFGWMSMVAGAGSILGNVCGTRLYKAGKHSESAAAAFGAVLGGSALMAPAAATDKAAAAAAAAAAAEAPRSGVASKDGISLPFIFAAALLVLSAGLLVAISMTLPATGDGEGRGEEGQQEEEEEEPRQVELTSLMPRHIDHPDFSSRVSSPAALRSRRQSKSPLRSRVVNDV